MPIKFYNTPINIKNTTKLKKYILKIIKIEKRNISNINIIFSDDESLLNINKTYLKHNYYTDIITFDLSLNNKEPIISDIFISVDRVRDNAKAYQTTLIREYHRVIFHGILHLCGYRDKTKKEIKIMRLKENEYLVKYGMQCDWKWLDVPRETLHNQAN